MKSRMVVVLFLVTLMLSVGTVFAGDASSPNLSDVLAHKDSAHQTLPPFAAGSLLDSFPSPVASPIGLDYDAARGVVWIASESGQIAKVSLVPPYTATALSLVGVAVAGDGNSDGVAVLPNGHLLLADFNGDGDITINDYLFEIDPDTLTLVNYWPVDGLLNTCTTEGLIDQVVDVEVGPNGHFYVTSAVDNLVHEISVTPGLPGTWTPVATHSPSVAANVVGIDRLSCANQSGWWLSDFGSTSLEFTNDSFGLITSIAASNGANTFNTGVTAETSTPMVKLWTVDFGSSTIGIFDSGQTCDSAPPAPEGDVILLTPNGGETLKKGSTFMVTWQTNTDAPVFTTELRYKCGSTWTTFALIGGNPGSYSWAVPKKFRGGSACKAQVRLRGIGGRKVASDRSDATFSIQ